MKRGLIAIGVLVVIALIFGGQLVGIRNSLYTQREGIRAAWAQVDNVLQRRADLIPNLVATVKGYAAHEKEVIEAISNARAAVAGARTPEQKIAANQQLDSALGRLLVIVENYPNLKANENFIRLQDELAGTENRIAQERKKYNERVEGYNVSIGVFPNNLAAAMFGFQREDAYFSPDPGARTAPKVQF